MRAWVERLHRGVRVGDDDTRQSPRHEADRAERPGREVVRRDPIAHVPHHRNARQAARRSIHTRPTSASSCARGRAADGAGAARGARCRPRSTAMAPDRQRSAVTSLLAQASSALGHREHLGRDPSLHEAIGERAVLARGSRAARPRRGAGAGEAARSRRRRAGRRDRGRRRACGVGAARASIASRIDGAVALDDALPTRTAPRSGACPPGSGDRPARPRRTMRRASASTSSGATASDVSSAWTASGKPPTVGHDGRRAARRGLDHDEAEALERARRDDADVGGAIEVDQRVVGDAPEQPHAVRTGRDARPAPRGGSRCGPSPAMSNCAPGGSSACAAAQASISTSSPIRGTSRRTATATNASLVELERRARGRTIAGREAVEVDARRLDAHAPRRDAVLLDEDAAKRGASARRRAERAGRPAVRARDAATGAAREPSPCGDVLVCPRPLEVHDERQRAQAR